MKKTIFEGSGVALVTPFKNNEVDYNSLEKILNYQLENNTDAIILCGTTAEASTMTEDEKIEVVKFSKKIIAGKVPIIVGAGSNCTKNALEFAKKVEKIGVDGLLIVTPYYNKTTQEGIIKHYEEIAKNVKLPIIVYNVPSRTGLNIKPSTIKELYKIENIVAVKEASGNISQVAEIAAICDIDIYSGNDDQIVPCLSLGGKGVISVVANILPKETHDMTKEYLNGNIDKAREIQLKYLNLINTLFIDVNPIPVKQAMEHLKLCNAEVRLPLVTMNETNKQILIKEIDKIK